MKGYIVLILCALCFTVNCDKENFKEDDTLLTSSENSTQVIQASEFKLKSIENNIIQVESHSTLADKLYKDKRAEKCLEIALLLQNILLEINTVDSGEAFLKVEGIRRVITPNLNFPCKQVKTQILLLLKTLFHFLPKKTKAELPVNVIDLLLEILDKDSSDLKAHVIDVLFLWLPNKPRIQSRIMKLTGLDLFYDQIGKLDASGIFTLLNLFNTILREHVNVRLNSGHSVRKDMLKFYERVGLIERMSSPKVCNGILNVFADIYKYNINNTNLLPPMFEMMKNVKNFCLDIYKGRNEAIALFDNMLVYVRESEKKPIFDDLKLNVTDVELDLEEILKKLKERAITDEL